MSKAFTIAAPAADDFKMLLPQLHWLDDRQPEMQELLLRLCNLNSGTLNLAGLERVREILATEYSALPGELSIHDVDPLETIDAQGNVARQELGKLLHLERRIENRPTALLCIHMDTVYPVDSDFQQCVDLPDGNINGPGVADAKGGLVVMLYALKALQRTELADQIGWEVIINPDEELGSPGSESFLKARAQQADFGLLFEPALPNGDFVSARKGVGNFTIVVRGRSAHSGREFEKGRNAIVCCCQIMNEVHQLNEHPDITYNVGKISGGTALNVVPDLAIGRLNIRVKTRQQMEIVKQQLDELVAHHSQREGYAVELHGRFTSPPKELTPEIESLQRVIELCGRELGQAVNWQSTGGASDGNKFASVGLPNVDTLGPLGGAIHSASEFVDPTSLVIKAKHTALILMAIAQASM